MSKIRLAICDPDTCYSERFVSYLAHYKAEEAEVYAYSEPRLFLEKIKQIPFEVIVLGVSFLRLVPELEIKNIPILVLVDEQAGVVREDSGIESTDYVQEDNCVEQSMGIRYAGCVGQRSLKEEFIPRYQPMETVWHRIRVLTAEKKSEEHLKSLVSNVEVIGVCAPGGHEMQLLFSLMYAELMAKESRVLYLNFMPYADFCELFGREDTYNMGDFVLALRSQSLTSEKLHNFVNEMDGVAYIAPFCNPEHMHELTFEDYQEILQAVTAYTHYEKIVVDFGQGMDRYSDMLNCCQRILCLTKEGFLSQCQLNQFLEYIRSETTELEKKVRIVNLPFQAKWIRGGGNLMEQLRWSEFGDFIRRNFAGGVNE